MMFDRVVQGRVVTPAEVIPNGYVAIAGERITAIGQGEPPPAAVVQDFGDWLIVPGGIDAQVHAGSYWGLPGLEPTTRAAACGGITTAVDMPFDHPDPLNTMERVMAKIEAVERLAFCDVALYGTVAPGGDPAVMTDMAAAGLCAFKISVCESHPVRFPRIPADQQWAMLQKAAALGLPLGIHNEDQEIVRAATTRVRATEQPSLLAHDRCRPEAAERAATALFLELAAEAGAHGHIVHISTPSGFDLLDQYRRAGFPATGEICVHYLTFDPAVENERLGALIKVNPPLRPGGTELLWEQIRLGRVDAISSDHSTMSLTNKEGGTFYEAGPGVPGIESLLPAFYTGLEMRGFDAPRALAAHLSEKPAKLFGLWPRKGAIALGADADLVVLEPGRFPYDSRHAHDDVNWSPYDGMVFTVRVAATLVRGTSVWDGTDVLVAPGFGRFVRRLAPEAGA